MGKHRVEWTPNEDDGWAPFPPTYEYAKLDDAVSHMNLLQPKWPMMQWRVRDADSGEVRPWSNPEHRNVLPRRGRIR